MREFVATFSRPVTAIARGSVHVPISDDDRREYADEDLATVAGARAETLLMQGRVPFTVDPTTVEYPEAAALERVAAVTDAPQPPTAFDPAQTPDARWADDGLQFMRLLAEMHATITFTPTQLRAVAASMDVAPDAVHELLDRALDAWDAYCATMP